jgi:NADP-dependent 3-hydroxy acid dehydrogenase YdfG
MKKKYNAKWALVTGAGTGIGKSIAETMAAQGLNVVLVSLPDKFLNETTEELKKNFPKQEFIAVPAVFDHKTDYMPAIIKVDNPLSWLCSYQQTDFFAHAFHHRLRRSLISRSCLTTLVTLSPASSIRQPWMPSWQT